ncbi:MAG: hypothetical protein OER91_01105 [Gammaproteobacteria bacterium]|nr:hypothetical protein [Gammaproteobacteria bacterium]
MNPRTVRSYLYEGIVIVASILVAFALDASWANYQESKVERRILGELKEEFESAKARIEISIGELETVIEASLELAGSLGRNTSVLSPDTAQDLIDRILTFNTLEVPTSVVDSIVASGQVRLISNSELREALAEWPAFIFDVRENHEWHREETDEYLIPYLARYLSIRDANVIRGDAKLAPGSFDYDLVSMQRDPVFEGRLVWRISRQQATLDESKTLLEETNKLLALIAVEIG